MTHAWGEDPEHPILPQAWQYRIVGLRLELDPDDDGEPFLDLALRRGAERRVLRFWSPRDLEIERDGPTSYGLVIHDVRARGLDRIGVRVDDFESSPGAIRFVARAVEELP